MSCRLQTPDRSLVIYYELCRILLPLSVLLAISGFPLILQKTLQGQTKPRSASHHTDCLSSLHIENTDVLA